MMRMVTGPILFFPFLLLSCSPSGSSEKEDPSGDVPDGEGIYQQRCASCHGMNGKKGVAGAKDLTRSELSLKERMEVIRNGRGSMIPFESQLSDQEIRAVAKYLEELRTER